MCFYKNVFVDNMIRSFCRQDFRYVFVAEDTPTKSRINYLKFKPL